MSSVNPEINVEGLTPHQAAMTERFVSSGLERAAASDQELAYFDGAAANLRQTLDQPVLELDRADPATYYRILNGLRIGTLWMQGLIDQGLSPAEAADVLETSLAMLHPKAENDTSETLDPREIEMLRPEETAIIVVDMMEAYALPDMPLLQYLDDVGAPSSTNDLDRAANNMEGFLEASRKFPLAATVFTRFPEGPATMRDNVRRKMEIDESPDVAEIDGKGWGYHTVGPQEGDIEVVKPEYDAFHNTDLDTLLKERGAKTVVIMGAYTSVCVNETASGARRNGYNVFVPADLTADIDTPNSSQTPEIIRKKLHMVHNVTGYMPMCRTILGAWDSHTS